MNEYYISDGSPLRNREGRMLMAELEGTPSTLGGSPQLAVSAPDEIGGREFTVILTVALDASITRIRLNPYGFVGSDPKGHEWEIPADIIDEMHAGPGTFIMPGNATEWLGPLANTNPTYVEVIALNSTGWGLIRDLWEINAEVITYEPFVVTANPVITSSPAPLVGGTPFTYTPAQWTGETLGEGSVFVTHYIQRAQNVSGTGAGSNEPIPATVPFDDGTLRAIRVRASAAGNGVADPAAFYDSEWVALNILEDTETEVEVDDAPMLPANIVLLDGVTNDSFDPYEVATAAGGETAVVIKYVPVTSTTGILYLGPTTGGAFDDNDAVTTPSGGAGVANGASTAWALTAGEPFYYLEPTFLGDVQNLELRFELYDDADDVSATLVELIDNIPPEYGSKQLELIWSYGGFGIDGLEEVSTGRVNIALPSLEKIADDDWQIIVEAEDDPVGDRVIEIWVKDSLSTESCYPTTAQDSFLSANAFPAGFETTTRSTTVIGAGGITWRKYLVGPALHGTPPKDYMNFDSTDTERRTRFGIVCGIGGALTPISDRKTVPVADDVEPTEDSDFEKWVPRPQIAAERGVYYGNGMQFSRGFDYLGSVCYKSFDITYVQWSDDDGETWYADKCDGLFMHQTTCGMIIDPPFVHGMFGPAYMTTVNSTYPAKSGIYRKNMNTGKWTRSLALDSVFGSNKSPMRRHTHYIAKVAGSGTDAASRTLFAMYAPSPFATPNFQKIQIYKSTAGGAPGTYAADGGELNVSTMGIPRWLIADAVALYMGTSNGVYRRPFSGTTWTKATLAAGAVTKVQKNGTTIWACVEGKGVYKAADATTLDFTLFKSQDAKWFDLSPSGNRLLMFGDKQVQPVGTHNAKAATPTWFNIGTQEALGQHNDFAHKLHGESAWCLFKEDDPDEDIVVAMRFQHPGKSTDGGKNFVWASNGEDLSNTHGICYHPTNPRHIFTVMTDRISTLLPDGLLYEKDGKIEANVKDDIEAIIGPIGGYHTDGALILTNNGHTGYVVQVAESPGNPKVPVIFSRATSVSFTSDPATTGNGTLTAVSATKDVMPGEYTLRCTVAGATGTFSITGPMGVDMGTATVGTPKTANHPGGGSISFTLNDGSINFTAGTTPKVFRIDVDPMANKTIVSATPRGTAFFAGYNPADPSKGFGGIHAFSMSAAGVITRTGSLGQSFAGFGGTSGTIVFGYSGNNTIYRSTNGGDSFGTAWSTNAGPFICSGKPIICCSSHDSQRVYTGINDGRVKRVQGGTPTVIFDWSDWVADKGITIPSPGVPGIGGAPQCMGVGESFFDENRVYACFYTFGAGLSFFYTDNALAANPTWHNITGEGAPGAHADVKGSGLWNALLTLKISKHTDEVFLCGQHGIAIYRPKLAFRQANGITFSLVDDIRNYPGLYGVPIVK